MQKYKEINGNDYIKNSRTTINETMQSIQSMNSGTAFPTTNLFEGMKCYRTDLKKTYTLTDVENNTWVEDAHATLSDEATHAASATKLDTDRSLNLGGAVTADAATFDGTANATINVKTLDATKLKGTASVSTTGNAATATKVVTTAAAGTSANIAEATMASSDSARIRVSGAENAGELALETADDGSEPIVARQYTGTYTTPVRTAKILDESGNTSFPGTVVAPKFTGALAGNAATATKLQTPRTLSLTGKAAGSATFDGSANAAINVTSVNADTATACSGNSATATKLQAARTINFNGALDGNVTFDGSKDVSVTLSEFNQTEAIIDLTDATKYDTDTYYPVVSDAYWGDAEHKYRCWTPIHAINTAPWGTFGAGDYNAELKVRNNMGGWGARAAYAEILMNSCIGTNGKMPITYCQMGNCGRAVFFIRGGGKYWFSSTRNATWELKTDTFTENGNTVAPTKTYFTPESRSTIKTIGINISGNAASATTATSATMATNATNASHASSADSATNADKVDGYHENSFLRYRGTTSANGEDTLWNQIGIKEYDNVLPESLTGTYTYGTVVSLPSTNNRLDLWYDCYASNTGTGLYYRTGWKNDKRAWARLLDSNNYTNWAPTKTGSGASGTWDISITGNATSATNATNAGNADTVDGIHADSMFYNKGDWGADNWGTIGAYQVNNNSPVSNAYSWGQVISSSTKNARFQLYASDQYGGNGRLHYRTGWDNSEIYPWTTILDSENYNLFAPTKTGGGASGTWGINISGNADSATNADKLDGYHASDIINRISAANTGGIVAASLTENGYVKFANGLILQWGNASGYDGEDAKDNYSTFPIAFPSTCFVVLLTTKKYITPNRLYDQSKTGFTWTARSGLISWAALGM